MNPRYQKRINYLLVFLVIVSLVLGVAGWMVYFQNSGEPLSFSSLVFLTLQLFTMNNSFEDALIPLSLNIARFLAPLSLTSAVISALASNATKRLVFFRARLGRKRPVIICGLSSMSLALAKNLKESNVFVIDPDPDQILWEAATSEGISVIQSDYNDKTFRALGVGKAELLVLCAPDKLNIKILGLECLKKSKVPIIANVNDQASFSRLKETPVNESDFSNVYFTSFEQIIASGITDEYSPDRYIIIDRESKPVRILLAGDHPILFYLIEEYGRMYHFANLKPLHISVLCPEPGVFEAELRNRQPYYDKVMTIDIKALSDFERDDNNAECMDVAFCLTACDHYPQGTQLAFRLRQRFYALNHHLGKPFMVLLNMGFDDFGQMIPGMDKRFENLQIHQCNPSSFLTRRIVVENQEKYDIIAKHINNSFCANVLKETNAVDEQWARLSPLEKDYNRFPARHFHIKLRAIGLEIVPDSHPEPAIDTKQVDEEMKLLLARMEKNRWNAEKFLTGFVPGHYQDDKEMEQCLKKELKYHPALKSWEQISQEEKDKDSFAFNNIDQILSSAGLKIIKSENQ